MTNTMTDIIRDSTLFFVPHGVENIHMSTTTTKKKNSRNVPTPIIPNTRFDVFVTVDAASSVPLLIASISIGQGIKSNRMGLQLTPLVSLPHMRHIRGNVCRPFWEMNHWRHLVPQLCRRPSMWSLES